MSDPGSIKNSGSSLNDFSIHHYDELKKTNVNYIVVTLCLVEYIQFIESVLI